LPLTIATFLHAVKLAKASINEWKYTIGW
jgi:hypothetical protein